SERMHIQHGLRLPLGSFGTANRSEQLSERVAVVIPKGDAVCLADPRFGFVGQSEPARRAQVIRTTLLHKHFARLPASVGTDLHAKGLIVSQFAQPLSGPELDRHAI